MRKKYKTRCDWVGKVIYWQLCNRLNFDHTTKWYMHKPDSVLKNEMHRIFWGIKIQTNDLIPDLEIRNKTKENKLSSGFCRSRRPQSENQRIQKERQVLGPCLRVKKAMEHEGDSATNCSGCTWNNPQRHLKETGSVWNRRMNQNYPDDSVV